MSKSPFSTHTAQPEFIHEMERFLSTVLSFSFRLCNPFLYRTKAECIRGLVAEHADIVPQSVSCWKSSRQAYSHCGECVPCIVRRIALEFHGLALPEYARHLFSEDIGALPPDDTGKRNLVELGEFEAWFGGQNTDVRIEEAFPELVNEHIDKSLAIAMYRRFAAEARTVLTRYPTVRSVLR